MLNNILLSVLLIGTLIAGGQAVAADQAASDQAIAAAKEAQKKAASVGGEWRDVGAFIVSAEAAAKDGNHDEAVKMANKAREHSELGYTQAVEQKEVTLPSYLTQ